ncbi:hypothetical protein B0T17DRAFT_30801 [Bombardia bombarda]|uniref:Uncharacterized protein n=1 Tax=Bombardia bombarda TaxID=252184 RepID=A0AA39XJC7_9PEZI|nr:hypothetical protein B0T17DRAFT_30801 [Bombardia bombarda]
MGYHKIMTMATAVLCLAASPASCLPPAEQAPKSTSRTSSSSTWWTPTSTPTSLSLAASCTYRPTQTFLSSSGCAFSCTATAQCTMDAALTKPCGCTSVVVRPVTTTVCPTRSPCIQCTTGWGIAIVSESPCPATTATTLPTAV